VERVTIKDLARASGVSVCTINKALNGKPWVSAATRLRVLELADRMGYQPNRLAQALARRPLSLAVVYPRFWADWFSPLVEGVKLGADALQDHHLTARLCPVDCLPSRVDFYPVLESLIHEGVDGLVLCSGGYSLWNAHGTAALLERSRLPVVLLGGDDPALPHLTCVRVDTHRCGLMANELLGLFTGGQPAAIFIGMSEDIHHRMKVDGFRSFQSSFACPVIGVFETHDDPDVAYAQMRDLVAAHPEVGGIYVAIDNSSSDICRFLVDSRLAGKIKVVSTGVFPAIGAFLQRGVIQASLSQSTVEQGRLAVHALFHYLTEEILPDHEVLAPPFIAVNSNFDLWSPVASPHLGLLDK
jgi:LacI family transcriptional regulator